MDANLAIVVALIALALLFDFINGFHDAANSIATVVSTRVLSPGRAVAWAAFFNFVAAFAFGTAVAKTVSAGMFGSSGWMRPSFLTSAGEPTHRCRSEAPIWHMAKKSRSIGEPP